MQLFDDIQRTELRPKYESESEFEYHNTSARAGVAAYRAVVEQWFDNYPEAHKSDLRARYRSRTQSDHFGAFFELYLHQLLLACCYRVDVHPAVAGTSNRPDFLVQDHNGARCYVEAVLASCPSKEAESAGRRATKVYDCLNQMNSPNFFLAVHVAGTPATSPPGTNLRRDLERWLARLDPDAISQLYAEDRREEVPRFQWDHDGWSMEFEPIPKSPLSRGKRGVRPVGMRVPEARWMNTAGEIRKAIKSKASRYGRSNHPFVVCVNILDWTDNVDVLNALLGDEQTVVSFAGDKVVGEEAARAKNGAFGWEGHPRSTRVSGVVVARGVAPFTMGKVNPELFHHPWAHVELPIGFWPMPQWLVNRQERRLERISGKSAWSMLGLPDPWPASFD